MTDTSVTTTSANSTAVPATIASLKQHEGQTVVLHGWLYNMRASGKLLFPIFRDGSGTVQGILPKAAVTPEVWETTKHLTQESSVIVTGRVRADQRAPGAYHLDAAHAHASHPLPHAPPHPLT